MTTPATQYDMTPQELRRAVEKYGLETCWPEIEAGLRNEVLLSPGESKYDDLPVGGTKQGGEPDLPPGMDWPKYSRRGVPGLRNTRKPMTFLMQLRCGDLRPFAPPQFPDHGLLSFFVAIEQNELVRDQNENPVGRVLYSPGSEIEMLVRTPFPRGLYFGNRLPPCSLKIESSTGVSFDLLSEIMERHFGFSEEIHDRVWNLYRQEIIPAGRHKLFGPSTALEGSRLFQFSFLETQELETELADEALSESGTNNDINNDWVLLLEFDPADLPPGLLADENGRLFYEIRRDDLAAGGFDKTELRHDDA